MSFLEISVTIKNRLVMAKKIIEDNQWYTICQDTYEGYPITIRIWKSNPDGADLLFDDNLAQANGYRNTQDMINSTIGVDGYNEVMKQFGYIPKWVRMVGDGMLYFVHTMTQPLGEA